MELFYEEHVRIQYDVESSGPLGSCIFIHHASVDPDFRRQGRYRKALDTLQERLQMPVVLESYHSLVGMYEKLGFRDEGLCHPDGYHEMVRSYVLKTESEDMETDYRTLSREDVQALGEKSFDDLMRDMDFTNCEHIETSVGGYGERGEIVHVYNPCFDPGMNLCYLHELQLLEPGKDPLSLASFFTDEMGRSIGPVLYRYPDGCFAGMDFYEPREADFSVRNTMKSVWFSNDGGHIDVNSFDLSFYSSLPDVEYYDMRFLPHFIEMQHLAYDFLSLLRTGPDESLLISFREDISSWPDLKLMFLEDLIREKAGSTYPQAVLDSSIERYVNGYLYGRETEQLIGQVSQELVNFLESHHVDMGLKETFELPSQNLRIDTYGEFSYKEVGCYEFSDTFKYVETFRNGIREGAHFLTSNSYGDFRIGPDVSFYPDGNIAVFNEHGYAGFETDLLFERHFNTDGRLCHPSEMKQDYRELWAKVNNDESERRDSRIDRRDTPARRIYRKTCDELQQAEKNDKPVLKR